MRGEKGDKGGAGDFFFVTKSHPRYLMKPQSFKNYNYGHFIVLTTNLNNDNKQFKNKRSVALTKPYKNSNNKYTLSLVGMLQQSNYCSGHL